MKFALLRAELSTAGSLLSAISADLFENCCYKEV